MNYTNKSSKTSQGFNYALYLSSPTRRVNDPSFYKEYNDINDKVSQNLHFDQSSSNLDQTKQNESNCLSEDLLKNIESYSPVKSINTDPANQPLILNLNEMENNDELNHDLMGKHHNEVNNKEERKNKMSSKNFFPKLNSNTGSPMKVRNDPDVITRNQGNPNIISIDDGSKIFQNLIENHEKNSHFNPIPTNPQPKNFITYNPDFIQQPKNNIKYNPKDNLFNPYPLIPDQLNYPQNPQMNFNNFPPSGGQFNPFQEFSQPLQSNIFHEDQSKRKKQFVPREGDWVCMKCKNQNFSFRLACNRCRLGKDQSEQLYHEHMKDLMNVVRYNDIMQSQVFNSVDPKLNLGNMNYFNPSLFSPNSRPGFNDA